MRKSILVNRACLTARFWTASKWDAEIERTNTKASGTCWEYQVLSPDFLISFQDKCLGNYSNVPDSAQILNIVDFNKNEYSYF